MDKYLLSIFPVEDRFGFARVNSVSMSESLSYRASPFMCSSPEALRAYLGRCFENTRITDVVTSIAAYQAVHMIITGPEMLRLGLALVSS